MPTKTTTKGLGARVDWLNIQFSPKLRAYDRVLYAMPHSTFRLLLHRGYAPAIKYDNYHESLSYLGQWVKGG